MGRGPKLIPPYLAAAVDRHVNGEPGNRPPMPWPWRLVQICQDPAASAQAGRLVFKWPFPTRDALYNGYFLDHMIDIWLANEILSRDPEKYATWEPAEQDWFDNYLEETAGLDG